MSKGTWTGHSAVTYAAGHKKQISTSYPLRGSMSPVLHRVLSVPLCCGGGTLESCFVFPFSAVLPGLYLVFPCNCANSSGRGKQSFNGPMESSCRDLGSCFHFPHSTAWPSKFIFNIDKKLQYLSGFCFLVQGVEGQSVSLCQMCLGLVIAFCCFNFV